MTTLRHPADERKQLLTIESLCLDTGYPLRKGGTAYLKWLLTRNDLDDSLRAAIHAELRRRGVE